MYTMDVFIGSIASVEFYDSEEYSMNNPELLTLLNTFPKISVIEAYTNRHIQYIETPWTECDVIRIAEVRLRANEMPEVYYETERSLKYLKKDRPKSKVIGDRPNTSNDFGNRVQTVNDMNG